jgi:tetratricopeptide (TPR) repeat protein
MNAAHPTKWAMLHTALARAYATQGDVSIHEGSRAIAHCRAALTVFTESEYPTDWALTQTILGVSLSCRADIGDSDTIAEALSSFEGALRVYREDRHPLEWAYAQFNCGAALAIRANQDAAGREADLGRAIGCFDSALKVWSEQRYPIDWAKAKTNLGTAHLTIARDHDQVRAGDLRRRHLQIAVACYKAALQVITQGKLPFEWALIQSNLPSALAELSSWSSSEVRDSMAGVGEQPNPTSTTPNFSESTVLFLRPFWDSDTTAAQLGTLAHGLHDVRSLVALRNGREGQQRWWSLARSRATVLPYHVRLVPSTRRRWQTDAIREISACDVVVAHLAPRELEQALPPIPSVDRLTQKFVQQVHELGAGKGLLRELAYCKQASMLDRTVVLLPATFSARVLQVLEILHHTPMGMHFQLLHGDKSASALPIMSAVDRGLAALQEVHAVIPYNEFGDHAFNEALRNALASCLSAPVTPGPRPLLLGIPTGPRALPPDWALKWIRFTRLELLTSIPPMEIVELSRLEVRLCRPAALAYFKVCRRCGRGRKTMFFYQRGRTPDLKPDATVHMDCQYCGFRDYY